MAITKGDWIQVSYKGTLSDGAVFDSSEGREHLTFEAGTGTVIKGFDNNVIGMEAGEEKEFTIPCVDAYGEVSDDQKEEVPMEFFKDAEKVEPGMTFIAQTMMGPVKVKVLTLNDDKAQISVNHPLAGEDLTFAIKVEKIMAEDEVKTYQEELAKKQEAMMKAQQEMMAKQAEAAQGGCGGSCSGCGGSCGSEEESSDSEE